MSTGARLTTTSYAILGLLAVRPWSTYELTRQMEWSYGRFWPRARSKLYEEPKKLEALGLATSTPDRVGQRARQVYSITPKGRQVLAQWQGEPAGGISLEAEPLLRIFLADHGAKSDALATLDAARAWAVERNEGNLRAARAFVSGGAEHQARAAQTMLVGAFLTDFYKLVADWAAWARHNVEEWPEDTSRARPDAAERAAILARAEWSENLPAAGDRPPIDRRL